MFLTKERSRHPGAGHPSKCQELSEFIMSKAKEGWEKGTLITSQELVLLFQRHVNATEDQETKKMFVLARRTQYINLLAGF
jgi:hypothetical protein